MANIFFSQSSSTGWPVAGFHQATPPANALWLYLGPQPPRVVISV